MWTRSLLLSLLALLFALSVDSPVTDHHSRSSSMSFGSPEPDPIERRPWNVDSVKTSSQQQNIPIPFFAGVATCPVDWITDAHNWKSKNVSTGGSGKGGKGGGGGQSSQKTWTCDIAGVTNFCPDDAPNDAILAILVNGELASSGPLYRAPDTHYVAFSLAKFSPACRFYWGTKDQPRDDLVISHISGELHSAYRNQGLFVAKGWFTGSTPNVQSILFILARGAKFFATRFEAGPSGVHPMGFAYEILTDEAIGFGVPASRLHQAGFEAVAELTESIELSPKLTSPSSGRSILATLSQYYDGWWRFTDGKIEPGFFSHGDVDVDALPELGSHEIIGEASITPGKLRDTKNVVFVTYSNRDLWYKDDDTEGVVDQENYLKQRKAVNDRVDARWILDGPTALELASARLRMVSKEKHTGNLTARRDRVTDLRQGLRFKSNLDSLELSFVWRIMARETATDRSGAVKFTLENERGIHPTHFIPDPAPGPPGFIIEPDAIENARIVELPGGLKNTSAVQVAILAQRVSQFILGAKIHFSLDDDVYEHIGTLHAFAAYGEVDVDYPADTDELDLAVGFIVNLSGEDKELLVSQTVAERDDNHLLWWCNGEIGSVGQCVSLGGDQIKIFTRRNRYGTDREDHGAGAPVYFIYREFLQRIAHTGFVPGSTRYFKLQPYVAGGDYDLDLVDPIAYSFRSTSALSLVTNLALTSHAYTDVQGERHAVILAAWDYSPDQDIVLFGVAFRRTSSIGLIPNEEQGLSFAISAKAVAADFPPVTELSPNGLDVAATPVRLLNIDEQAWNDVICIGGVSEERPLIIDAADAEPGLGLRLFEPTFNLWYDLLAMGVGDERRLALSAGEPGLGDNPARVIAAIEAAIAEERPLSTVPSTPDAPWNYIAIDTSNIEIPVTAGVSYDIKVRPINSWGEIGEYCEPKAIIAGMIDLFQIVNLRIAGQDASDHVMRGVDCHLVWDIYSPSQDITIQGGPDGTTRGPWDPGLVDFEIKIYKDQLTLEQIIAGEYIPPGGSTPVPIVKVWRDVPTSLNYDFLLGKNTQSTGGPHPIFTAWVGAWDPANRAVAPQVFYVTKERPQKGSNIVMSSAIGAMDISWTNPDEIALDYVRIDISGLLADNVRKIPFPGTTHRVVPLTNGSSYIFLLRWFDKFGLASDILESEWSPEVGGGAGSGVPAATLTPDGGAIDNTASITASHPVAAMYWRRDTTQPTVSDTLYTAPIEVDPPGSEDPFDISIIPFKDGIYGPPITKHFLPFTAGGGSPPDQPAPPYTYPFPVVGPRYIPEDDLFDVQVASDQPGDWTIFYTYTFGLASVPDDPTHTGDTPTGDTIKATGTDDIIRAKNVGSYPAQGLFRIKALVWKPGATFEDSTIHFATYYILPPP